MSFEFENPKGLYSNVEAYNAYRMYERFGATSLQKIFPFDKPRGPSRFLCYDGDYLVFESLLTDKKFRVTPDKVLGKQPMTEMEVIAWAAR